MSDSFASPWTVACQDPLSVHRISQARILESCHRFVPIKYLPIQKKKKKEYWSGWPFPLPGDFPDAGIEPKSPVLAGSFFTTEPPGSPLAIVYKVVKYQYIPLNAPASQPGLLSYSCPDYSIDLSKNISTYSILSARKVKCLLRK